MSTYICVIEECEPIARTESEYLTHLKVYHRLDEKRANIIIRNSIAPDNVNKVDMVNHPRQYARFKFEPIDVLQDWFPTNPLLWQVAKYIARAEYKGNVVEDLKKARFYLDREIKRINDSYNKKSTMDTITWQNNIFGVECFKCKALIILGQLAKKYYDSDNYVHRKCYLEERQEH